MTRPSWEDLPESIRDAVQERCGPVPKAETAADGGRPGVAARLYTETGSVFVKATPSISGAATLHLREEWANRALPEQVPSPRMLWRGSADGWHMMLFEYVDDARRVDLSPGSPDLPAVLDTLDLLGRLLTPGPNGALPVTFNMEALQAKARHLLDTGRLADRDLFEAALRGFSLERLRGDTMLHYDLNAGDLLISAGRVHVLNWSFAVRGAAWIDCALFAPRLVAAGHSPAQADLLLSGVPAWRAARPDAVAALAALWTLLRMHQAMHGPEETRAARTRAAEVGRSWLVYRSGVEKRSRLRR
ncbi:hypothetical protein LDL08_36620 [Nonomuraea glycinis]|uniref:Aminoglycoside phosphotransferase n=1 Tax=Nonomuraea glycinis TaxID=2047744 RepID=A0A918EA85_9ACTN|nr:hypothetical protein [Nonomuraea glycinis]MCA2181701.1 hypothetical protein [Nonomuraea glycinis]GGP14892.1 hypothetical protein GCM10012278_72460 [Nonomuraea glycinis]